MGEKAIMSVITSIACSCFITLPVSVYPHAGPSPHISQCSVGVLTVPEKSTLSLSCLVQPNQNLATNWSRDHGHMDKSRTSTSIHLQDGMENVSLHITDVKNSDEDVYTLKASNVCGEDVYQVQVIVQKGGKQSVMD